MRPAPALPVRPLLLLRRGTVSLLLAGSRTAHRPIARLVTGMRLRRGPLLARLLWRGLLIALLPVARLLIAPLLIAPALTAALSIARLLIAALLIAGGVIALLSIARLLIAGLLIARAVIARL